MAQAYPVAHDSDPTDRPAEVGVQVHVGSGSMVDVKPVGATPRGRAVSSSQNSDISHLAAYPGGDVAGKERDPFSHDKKPPPQSSPRPSSLHEYLHAARQTRVNLKAAVSDAVGTFIITFFGTAAATMCGHFNPACSPDLDENPDYCAPEMVNQIIVGFAFGIGVLVAIYATAHHGGGHLNPAITIAFVVSTATPILQGAVLICGQIIGALLASGFLRAIVPDDMEAADFGANAVPPSSTAGNAFLAEAVGTFVLMYIVLEVAVNPAVHGSTAAPLAAGLTVAILLTILSPVSSGSLNPARSLGPAAVSGQSEDLWIWIFGPILGALIALPFHLYLRHGPGLGMVSLFKPDGKSVGAMTVQSLDTKPDAGGGV